MPHIVDILIEERAEHLMQHPGIWRLVKKFLYPVLGYRHAVNVIDGVQGLSGLEVFHHMSTFLNMQVDISGQEHLPATGRAILMPNHPAGIADGIAVFDGVKAVRQDVSFFANRDAVRAATNLSEVIIPVEWMEQRRDHSKSKDTVRHMLRAFRDERLIVIFPSGRLAEPTLKGLVERPWLTSAVGLAQKYNCPIIPLHVTGSNSLLYYLLWYLNTELKDMTLFRELLNKRGRRYHMQFGEAIAPTGDPEALTQALRHYVVNDLKRGITRFERPPSLQSEPACAAKHSTVESA